ncbi:3887_t:CDS:1, partial [Gigaspora margarita]
NNFKKTHDLINHLNRKRLCKFNNIKETSDSEYYTADEGPDEYFK